MNPAIFESFACELFKLAEESSKEKTLRFADKIRPYGQRAAVSAFGAGSLMRALTYHMDKRPKALPIILAGAALGAGDKALENMAKKPKYKKQLKNYAEELAKAAALGMDLRENGMANVDRPSFPTEDSAGQAHSELKKTTNTARFGGMSPVRTPSIAQQAVKIGPR